MIQETLAAYLEHFPEDADKMQQLQDLLATGDDVRTRKNFQGHLTAGGIVLNPGRTAILMIRHQILQRWFQPGGHVEEVDNDILAAAHREVEEETGQRDVEQIVLFGDPSMPIEINSHYIPANPAKAEPEHYHHEFRYVFVAKTEVISPQLEEVSHVEWVPLDDERVKTIGTIVTRLYDLGIVAQS